MCGSCGMFVELDLRERFALWWWLRGGCGRLGVGARGGEVG